MLALMMRLPPYFFDIIVTPYAAIIAAVGLLRWRFHTYDYLRHFHTLRHYAMPLSRHAIFALLLRRHCRVTLHFAIAMLSPRAAAVTR